MQLQILSTLLLFGLLSYALPKAPVERDSCGSSPSSATSTPAPSLTPPLTPPKNATDPDSALGKFVSVLTQVAPNSNSCDNAVPKWQSQCATAEEAAMPLLNSFIEYNISTNNEKAALISLIAYETSQFRYDRNEFPAPGNPGQCTRAVMSPTFVLDYAKSLPRISSQLSQAVGDANSTTTMSNTTLNAMCDVVTAQPDIDWAAPAWFLTTQCNSTIIAGLQTGGQQGWEAYIEGCVYADPKESNRTQYYQAAVGALNEH